MYAGRVGFIGKNPGLTLAWLTPCIRSQESEARGELPSAALTTVSRDNISKENQ